MDQLHTSAAFSASAASSPPTIVLTPKRGWQPVELGELWHYRELLWILAMRDVRVRYKQTALGAAWAIIQPFFTMVVFTIVFAGFAKIPTDGVPAPVFFFCGLLPWQLFSNALTQAGNSLIGNQNLITKVYFPRLVIPIASVITGLIDFAIAMVVLCLLMAWYHVVPGAGILLLPVFVLMSFLAALAVGLWLSALNVEFRDVRYVIPFLTQFWMYATPIAYPASIITKPWQRAVLGINPLSGVVEGFRWCLLGRPIPPVPFVSTASTAPGPMLFVSAVMIVMLLFGGLMYFRRMEKTFADLV